MAISDAQRVLPLAADSKVQRGLTGQWMWWLRWTSFQLLLIKCHERRIPRQFRRIDQKHIGYIHLIHLLCR